MSGRSGPARASEGARSSKASSGPSEAPRTEFAKLIERLREVPGAAEPVREGFGERPLYAGRKMFAHLEDSGALVFRLPADRVESLVAEGVGNRWGVAEGTFLKGYLAVPLRKSAEWFGLAQGGADLHDGQEQARGCPEAVEGLSRAAPVGER